MIMQLGTKLAHFERIEELCTGSIDYVGNLYTESLEDLD